MPGLSRINTAATRMYTATTGIYTDYYGGYTDQHGSTRIGPSTRTWPDEHGSFELFKTAVLTCRTFTERAGWSRMATDRQGPSRCAHGSDAG